MRIYVHIGMEHCGADRLQQVLDDKRGRLSGKGVHFAQSPGRKNHTRLYMAVCDPDHVDLLRFSRGYAPPERQEKLRTSLARDLASEVARNTPETLILSASQLSTLPSKSELERLRAFLLPLSDDIRIVAHVDEQARVLARHYGAAVLAGRTTPLDRELEIARSGNWHGESLKYWAKSDPSSHGYPEIQAPPHWLDYRATQAAWEDVFGAGRVTLRPYDAARFASGSIIREIRDAFDIEVNFGKTPAVDLPAQPAGEWLTRMRLMNEVFVKILETGRVIPRPLWGRFASELEVPGPATEPGALAQVSRVFEADNQALKRAHPGLTQNTLRPGAPGDPWVETPATKGYRATQYATTFMPRIESATRQASGNADADAGTISPARAPLTPIAQKLLSQRAKDNYHELRRGRFAPHNRLGRINEDVRAPAFDEVPMRTLPPGNSGNVIVGCMKNEAPYILEWVAYHRAIGVDNFIIYTNGCEDGTSELLDRLQQLGVLQHRNNDNWKGNSPQQHALNQSLKEKVIKNAEWVIHIDVDEFINVQCGNGTLDDFLRLVPDATNVAMTWRMFGYNGVEKFTDDLVVEQFDTAAPKFCPKPHTVWGFKTMVKNIGAYEKLSCHRPNKLRQGKRDKVMWVNGSGQPMGEDVKEKGWRSSLATVGYDHLQLNHYALRSAESYLIKRQRGRALHVDRSIGINYWVRMDWSDNKDVSIKRNLPRLRAELERLLQDDKLRALHEGGVAWHKQRAADLHAMPEFQDLYTQALEIKLTEMERVAFALALDVES